MYLLAQTKDWLIQSNLFVYHLKALDIPVYKLAPHGLTDTSHWSAKKIKLDLQGDQGEGGQEGS